MSKVGNQTSSQDPQAVNSRIFVGNLNTFQITKSDVERLFQKYGRIAGISMHKGYAFVQFTSPFDARSACLGEDAKLVCGQILDVNMVNEPKEHVTKLKATKRKESVVTPTGLGYSIGTPGGIVTNQMDQTELGAKRARVDDEKSEEKDSTQDEEINLETLKSYETADILICGNCRMIFPTIVDMIEHKRVYCKLRFTCKCADEKLASAPSDLRCAQCQTEFADPWDLMEHVQDAHTMNLYRLVDPDDNFDMKSDEATISIDWVAC